MVQYSWSNGEEFVLFACADTLAMWVRAGGWMIELMFSHIHAENRASWFLFWCKIRAMSVSELHGWHWNLKCQCPSGRASPTRSQDPTWAWNHLTNHWGARVIHWLSQCFDSLCSTTVALSAGLHGASHGCRWASLTGRLTSTRNPSCDSPHVGRIYVHARVHTNICARAPLKRDMTPLRSVNN